MFRVASMSALAGSAAVVGLVWASRFVSGRARKAKADPQGFTGGATFGERGYEADALDHAERMEAEREPREPNPEELDFDIHDEAESIDALDHGPMLDIDEMEVADEPYDALDAEDVGTEWLLRATQTGAPIREEIAREGDTLEANGAFDEDSPNDAGFGSDQEGAPLAEYAGTHDADLAAELPVGTVDAQGNTELHKPRPSRR